MVCFSFASFFLLVLLVQLVPPVPARSNNQFVVVQLEPCDRFATFSVQTSDMCQLLRRVRDAEVRDLGRVRMWL